MPESSVYSYPGFHKNKQPSPESSNHYDDVNPYDMPDVGEWHLSRPLSVPM